MKKLSETALIEAAASSRMSAETDTVVVWNSAKDRHLWRWTRYSRNGRIVGQSSEWYSSLRWSILNAIRLNSDVSHRFFIKQTGDDIDVSKWLAT